MLSILNQESSLSGKTLTFQQRTERKNTGSPQLNSLIAAACLALFAAACSGSYYGLDGPDVIPRDEALQKINDARLVKIAQCGLNETNGAFLYLQYTQNPRKILDGAYYSTRDVDSCTNNILWGSCDAVAQPCGMSPAEFFDGAIFQGGF